MNIVIVTNTDFRGETGASHGIDPFVAECRRQGHHVLVIAPRFSESPADDPDTIHLPAAQVLEESDFAISVPLASGIEGRLEAFRPQIVHSFQPFLLGATALRIAARYSIPLVFTHQSRYESGYVQVEFPALKRFAAELAIGYCNLADAVICPNRNVAAVLENRGVKTRVEVAASGIDLQRFADGDRGAFRQAAGIPSQAFVIGHAGTWWSRERAAWLMRAVAEFLRFHRDAHFVVLDNGSDSSEIRKRFDSFRIGPRLHILDSPAGERADAYAALDVLVSESGADTPEAVVLEAMAAGVPVVAVESPGVHGLVQDGEYGRVLSNPSRKRLRLALQDVARQDLNERQQWQVNARARAAEFSLSRCTARVLRIYEELAVAAPLQPKQLEQSAWEAVRRRIEIEAKLWAKRSQAARIALTDRTYPSRVPILRHCIEAWRWFRRWTSRREWSVWLFDLPISEGTADEPGLALLQIDGLSREQLERALRGGQMPFLQRLLSREHYSLQTMYSGQPATTPAVLGELFYGVPQAVPAFGFRDHRTGQVVQMFMPGIASTIQHELAAQGEPLLAGGAAYSDIYSGGAEDSSFCPATTGWRNIEDAAMWRRLAIFLLNIMSLVRIVWMLIVELVLAVGDALRGIRRGHDIWRELLYIPRRLIVNILLRELVTISVETDVTRGVRVLHANLLGYDENAHRRGPEARFAHYALRGIDHAIHRIWNAAHASRHRNYHVWIMADHGQEGSVPYSLEFGCSIGDAVIACYHRTAATTPSRATRDSEDEPRAELQRARWLRRQREKESSGFFWEPSTPDDTQPITVAIGPIGYVYWPDPLQGEDYDRIARQLIAEARVPLVMAAVGDTVWAWNAAGKHRMPDDATHVLAPNHPHLASVAEDLAKLCFHPDAGDFLISGWRNEERPISFVSENGAHGGPGPQETSGFALLPPDAPLPLGDGKTFRPLTLRQMALTLLGRGPLGRRGSRKVPRSVRLVTYNVHGCIGLDGRLSPSRIARVLATLDPDIIALQELDVRRERSRFVDQAQEIAHYLEMALHFQAALEVEEQQYGNAILTRFPSNPVRAGPLPSSRPGQEPRGALWVEVDVHGLSLQVLTTHLGLAVDERDRQIDVLLGPQWLGHEKCREPVVLCGDFNIAPRSRAYRRIATHLRDVQTLVARHAPHRTWFSPLPLRRIDHIFVGEKLRAHNIVVPRTQLSRIASDHLPLAVSLELL